MKIFCALIAGTLAVLPAYSQELSPRAQVSIECSRQADEMGLRGRARSDFRASCKLGGGGAVVHTGPTTICIRPMFQQELKLKGFIDGTDDRTQEVGEAIVYLRDQFCRTTHEVLMADRQQHVTDNCFEYSGIFRRERVYWGKCHE